MPLTDINERAEYYRIRARRQGRGHYLAARRSQRLNNWFGVPVVIITTVVGTTIFSTISSSPSTELKIIAGLLSLIAGVFAALQTFFKFAEQGEKHLRAAASYYSVKRNLDMFLLQHPKANEENRDGIIKQFNIIIDEIDQMDKESPNVPDYLYDQAKREQIKDKEGT